MSGPFVRALLYAGVAGATTPLMLLLLERPLTPHAALGATALLLAVGHGVAVGPDPRTAWRALWLGVGLAAIALLSGVLPALPAAAAIVAVVRSHFWRLGAPLRQLAIEIALVIGGVAVARSLGDPSLLGAAIAAWSFFVVQSLAFAGPAARPRDRTASPSPEGTSAGSSRGRRLAGPLDPFEQAREAATAAMGGPTHPDPSGTKPR